MLYAYHGQDIHKSLEKARTLANSLRAKRPDATYIEVEKDSWSPAIIEENIGGQGLFSSKYIVFLNRVTENAEAKESLPNLIQVMNESTNIFILLEAKLNAELKKAVEKYAEKAVETSKDEAGGASKGSGRLDDKAGFNIFALADAVGSRNALKAWMLYRQAVDSGLEAENIIGVLFWKMKSMITARDTGNYSDAELRKLMTDLIVMYHDGHRGIIDAEVALERFTLGLARDMLRI
jgi:DNA polymerase III delta subunit